MRQNITNDLTNQLTQAQRELSSSSQTLNNLQTQLFTTQNAAQQAENQLNSAVLRQAHLNNQIEIQNQTFNALSYLLDQYRESEGITLNPSIAFTRAISAEELAHTDILKEACKANYHEGFDIALNRLTNLDFQDSDGKTILMHAIINGFYYGVDKLLQKGANVNLLDNQGNNALIYCSQIPHIKYFKQIAEKTENVNYKMPHSHDNTALHELIINTGNCLFVSEVFQEMHYTSLLYTVAKKIVGELEGAVIGSILLGKREDGYTLEQEKTLHIIRNFIESGNVNINVQNDIGNTPLYLATKHLFFDIVDLLFNRYHAQDLPNKYGYTAWDVATINIQQKLIDIFLPKKGFDPEAVKFWCAAKKGELNIVQQQINKGVDVNFAIGDIHNTTPLMQSIISGHLPIVSALIGAGADINILSSNGLTPLMVTISYNRFEITKFLLQHNANVNIPDNSGLYPIHFAAYNNFLNILELLISYCNVNQTTNDEHKVTALWLAAQDGKLEIIKLLVDHGADINLARVDNGVSPLCVSIQKQHLEVTKELLVRGADVNIPITEGHCAWHIASLKGSKEVMQLLKSKIPDVDYKTANSEQYTALWLASQAGHTEIVKWLVEFGADVNAVRQSDGATVLQAAIVNNHLPIVKMLIEEYRADINKADNSQVSPLYYSLGYVGQPLQPAIVKYLISKGANVNQAMHDGDTPLHMSCYKACIGAIKLLLDKGANINATNEHGKSPLHLLIEWQTPEKEAKLPCIKYLLLKSASTLIVDNTGINSINSAITNFPEAVNSLEHPEILPNLQQFEASIIGLTQDFII